MIEYDPHRWREFFKFKGTMVVAISRRSGIVLILAAVVAFVHHHVRPLAISDSAHGLIGAALSLLLVFRTNSSNERFWEGRKLWGSIVNSSRNLTRLAVIHLARNPDLLRRTLRLLMAFPYSSMNELRGLKGIGPVEKELDAKVAEGLLRAHHTPAEICKEISACFQEAKQQGLISEFVQMQIDKQPSILVDCIGACERIHKTPLPFAYVVHLRRMLALYCGSLPFALLDKFGWNAIPISFLIASVLFGIEEIGVEIEDPFGTDDNDLPLEGISASIERHIRANMPAAQGAHHE